MAKRGHLTHEAAAIAERRERVWRLALENGLRARDIATVIGVSQVTVERDFAALRRLWRRKYGGKVDVAELVGFALDRLRCTADLALQNFTAGNGVTADGKAKPMSIHERMYCLRTAIGATAMYTRTLALAGLIQPHMTLDVRQRFDGREIAALGRQLAAMRAAQGEPEPDTFDVTDDMLTPPGERAYLNGTDDEPHEE